MKTTKTTTTEANKEKRQARKKATAEDFTPSWLVNKMIDKLKEYSPESLSDHNKTFLDPACGNGNMLVEVLKHKLESGSTPIQALNTIFGCDIMMDNINECRLRLMKVIAKASTPAYRRQKGIEIIQILARNIVCTPLDKFPNGSLDYLSLPEDETFNRKITEEQAQKTLTKIATQKLLDNVLI